MTRKRKVTCGAKTHFEQIPLEALKITGRNVREKSRTGTARNSPAVPLALVRRSGRHVTNSN